MSTHLSTIELPPGSVVMARYMGQGDLCEWVVTYPTGSPVWISGSTRCTWAALTDQQSLEVTETVHHKNGERSDNRLENLELRPEVTTDPDGTDDSDEPIDTPYPPSDPHLWDRTPKRRGAFRPDLTEQDTPA